MTKDEYNEKQSTLDQEVVAAKRRKSEVAKEYAASRGVVPGREVSTNRNYLYPSLKGKRCVVLDRFRDWYCAEVSVQPRNKNGALSAITIWVPVDALTMCDQEDSK